MANIGIGTARNLVDSDGDALDDGAGRLNVNASVGAGASTFTSYDQVAAPTSVNTLASVTASITTCKEIIIQVDHGNSGFVMVGSTGTNAASTQRGLKLYAGDMLVLPIASTANVYLEGSASSQNINVSLIT